MRNLKSSSRNVGSGTSLGQDFKSDRSDDTYASQEPGEDVYSPIPAIDMPYRAMQTTGDFVPGETLNLKAQIPSRTLNVFKSQLNTKHNGDIEEYFKDYNANEPHDLRSTSKSIRSILLGIAIDKRFIDNINDPIYKYLKNHFKLL